MSVSTKGGDAACGVVVLTPGCPVRAAADAPGYQCLRVLAFYVPNLPKFNL